MKEKLLDISKQFWNTMEHTDEPWGPLSEAQKNIFQHKTLVKIAEKHGKTAVQVSVRWQ